MSEPNENLDMQFYLEHLDSVRLAGFMNMFGSVRYLTENFDLSRKEANDIFTEWSQDTERHMK